MNEIVNKFLLAGDKFKPEMHLKQPGFTYSACGLFTENKERIQKNKETGDTSYIYKNELDIAYGYFKGLGRTTACDKVLRDKAFNVAKNQASLVKELDFYYVLLIFLVNMFGLFL